MRSEHDDSANANDGATFLDAVDSATVESIAKPLLGAVGLAFLLGLVSVLPGIDRLVPATPVSVESLVVAVVTLGIVALLLTVADRSPDLVREALGGPADLRAPAGAVAKHLIVLAAVLVAHRGLAGAFVPLLAQVDAVWAYDLAFLGSALIPTALVARHLYGALDPAAGLLSRTVASDDSAASVGSTASVGSAASVESESESEPEATTSESGSDDAGT